MLRKIEVIDTGGTLNKRYDPLTGKLEIDLRPSAVSEMFQKWAGQTPHVVRMIGKDSLDMTTADRIELLSHIIHSETEAFLMIHGTDTMELTARYLDEAETGKCIVLTGAMIPFAFDPTEAVANIASAWGFLQNPHTQAGVYIAMHAMVLPYHQITKNKRKGRFEPKN